MVHALLLVARWIAVAHDHWRTSVADGRPRDVEIALLKERLERVRSENDILRERLARIDPRRRPHYRPWERMRILWHQARYLLSLAATAKAFLVTVQTLVNWRRAVERGEGPEVDGRVPLRRISDAAAELVLRIKRDWPRWGSRRIAGILARLGLSASRTTVQRLLQRPPPAPTRANDVRGLRGRLVPARPDHVWLMDFTRVGSMLRSVVVGAVIDGFSRRVLAIAVCHGEPTALFAVRLLRDAVRRNGAPTWMVTDRGTQFTASGFTRVLRRLGIGHRYGAVGRKGSIALLERFWRTMKSEYAGGLVLFRPLGSIRVRLTSYVAWLNRDMPHQGLAQRTPEEVHTGRSTRPAAVPLRAGLVARCGFPVVYAEYVAGDRDLPVLRLRRAA
jgi:putative transposase